jgi:hypothetical protein
VKANTLYTNFVLGPGTKLKQIRCIRSDPLSALTGREADTEQCLARHRIHVAGGMRG